MVLRVGFKSFENYNLGCSSVIMVFHSRSIDRIGRISLKPRRVGFKNGGGLEWFYVLFWLFGYHENTPRSRDQSNQKIFTKLLKSCFWGNLSDTLKVVVSIISILHPSVDRLNLKIL